MSDILTGFNMQGNDPIDDRIVSKSNLETLEQYLKRVPVQKRYYGLTFFALDKNNELRKYTFQTSLINPTIDDDEEEIERIDKKLQEHVSNKAIHKTSEEIRSEIVDADIPNTIARVQWTLDQINTAVINLIGGASDEYNTLKRIQTKIEELRAEMESQLYGDDGDTVLKTLEQALKFLNQYKDFIVDIPENFVNKQDIVDNLTTDDPTKVLSAKQGKVLSDTLTNYFESAMQSIRTETDRAINAENRIEAKLDKEIDRSIKEDQRIDSKLDSEINRSTTEDDRLDKKIDAETTRATTAESNLNTKIETETDRAESEESRIETKLDNEITRSTNKDTEHDNRLTALEGETHEQNTDLGTTNSTFQLKYNTGNKIKHESDAISVRNAADTDYVNFIAKNATFKGDLLVEGQSFVTEAETVEIKDNLLLLNKGEVGAGVTKGIAGLEIDRGTEPNYFIVFDESDDRFKAGKEGDLEILALRDSDDGMKNGMFTTWDSINKILKTTNIVPSDQKLSFGDNGDIELKYSLSKMGEIFSSAIPILNIGRKSSGYPHIEFGLSSSYAVVYTDSLNGIYLQNQVLGRTFKRATDLSEVLYHADIVNDLTSGGTNKVLSAEQGKLLQNSITNIQGSYLPLSGGTMTGSIRFPVGLGIVCEDVSGSAAYDVLRTWNYNGSTRMYVGTVNFPTYISSTASDLIHDRNGSSYLLWDSYNLLDPAKLSADQTFTGLNTFTKKIVVGSLTPSQILLDPNNEVVYRFASTEVSRGYSISLGTLNNIRKFTYGGYYSASKNDEYAYLSLPTQSWDSSSYKFYADKLAVPKVWSLTDGTVDAITLTNSSTTFGRESTPLRLRGDNTDLIYYRGNNTYKIWDKFNLSDPATLSGNNTFTGNNTFQAGKFNVGSFEVTSSGSLLINISTPAGSGWARNLIFRANSDSTSSSIFGGYNTVDNTSAGFAYIGIGDVVYSTAQYKFYANSLRVPYKWSIDGPDGNAILWSQTSEIVNLGRAAGTTKIRSGNTDLIHTKGSTEYIIWDKSNLPTPATSTDLTNYLPLAGGTLTGQVIFDSYGLAFNNITWSNDLVPNRSYGGYLQVLDAYNKSSAGGPTNYGTVLQVNSRNAHWANQLWFPGGAEASKNDLYYRHMAYNETTYGEWNKLLTNKDVNILSASYNNNPNSLPINQIFYAETQGVTGTPTSNGLLFSVQGNDEGIQLWAGANRTELYYRTKWTSFGEWIKLATTSNLGNYLPLTGGTLSGQLIIGYAGSTPLIVNNSHTNGVDSILNFKVKGVNKTLVGYSNGNGPFIQDASSNRCIMVKSDGAYFGTGLGAGTKLALITDIPTVSGYLPLSGGTLTGALTMNSRKNNAVIDVVGGTGNNWNEGAGALSVQVPGDGGQTPLLLARRSGATINTTTLSERLLDMALLDTGTIFRVGMSGVNALELEVTSFTNKVGTGKLFGKQIATTDQIPSIPNISISNSGSGNAVTAISASGHTLTVTKGATYLTSSSLDGYATQAWVNSKGYLTSHQTIYDLTFQAGTFAAKTFDPNGAAATVNIPTSTSHLTNDSGFITSSALSGYTTQEWVNGQGFLTSDSILDKFVPTTGGYIRNSDQILLRLQRTGVSTGTSRTIEMYFDDSNADGTSITPRGSIGYNSEVGMFLYSAVSKKFLAMEYTGRPFYGTPENRYYLLGSNTQYHNLDGYQRIGDIMIQWGYFTVQGNSTRAVNFPVSFTNTVWSVTGSWDNTTTGSQENWGFTDYTSSGFTIINGDGSSRVFHYIAIGPFTRS